MTSGKSVKVLGIGGSLREGSQSERALRIALAAAEERGVVTELIPGPELVLPFYDTAIPERDERARKLIEGIRQADGLIVVSPGYHGGLSGLVKNALDYVEDLREDARPYLDGRAVGLAAVAYGWQAAVTTLEQLRTITHALRGWSTPLGGSINSAETKFDEAGGASDEKSVRTLRLIGEQVAEHALLRAH
ncbi:NADPH-dependent FMN reductase [Amycolatopsis orientalis]|uniref:NADPH-dependent FMN reductase n=1 Tax=Amycolatopsis orientalis TaxID=31958 RepID=UPI0003A9887A|nr:NADPH-dependent FMN reductase [Amycolatopsis orientalis]